MSTTVWPPISPADLIREENESRDREIQWLLQHLQETLSSVKSGLDECAALLSPDKGPSTLVLSSQRSESLKGFVTRVGTRILKGDINLRLASLPVQRGQQSQKLSISSDPQAPTLILEQLVTVQNLIAASLDVIDVSRWTGDARNADFISGQLRLLLENVQEAKNNLRGRHAEYLWTENPIDEEIFEAPYPSNVAFNLDIADAALLLNIRILEPANGTAAADSMSGLGIRDRLVYALGGAKPATHDEAEEVFSYKGQSVRVREKVRVESQDPSLLSAMAKLGALEHSVAMGSKALETLMGIQD